MSEENNVGLRENQEYNAQVTANTVFMNELKNKLPEYFTTSGSFDLEKFQENFKENNIDEHAKDKVKTLFDNIFE